jgi:RHH-type proline utilization regulon transcriptional repressor/proline dehydrogenase/delta 1-pyrroline-5-carboxylate dehydrogenase
MFTGSTEVARLIQRQLAGRLSPEGRPIPLIAETGGQNAMIVDSSALAEQVVGDVIASAFDSAGQRCSALRVLCLQEDVADRTLEMLKGALAELQVGNPDRLSTDVGPVITAEAQRTIVRHIEAMRAKGCRITQFDVPADAATEGTFVAPTIIEIGSVAELGREVFGPVLHVVRFRREELGALIGQINATGYGLTFGLHTRLDGTVGQVTSQVRAGNLYVNRNTIGAVVGSQPFGGRGLSGTGPKAGGPLYPGRLVKRAPGVLETSGQIPSLVEAFAGWLEEQGETDAAIAARALGAESALGTERELPGPVGERNLYALHPRGRVLLRPASRAGLLEQMAAVLATGNRATVEGMDLPGGLPAEIAAQFRPNAAELFAACLVEGGAQAVVSACKAVAAMEGPIVPVHTDPGPNCAWLLEEVSTSINTTAAGGNASLLTIG